MALPSSTTIQNLTRCKTLPGFFPGGFCDQFIRRIPFQEVSGYGQEVQINRATLGAADNYAAGGTLPLNAGATTLTSFEFQRIGDTVEVDSADISSSEETQQQLDLQVQMKKVAVIRQLADQVIQGDGTGGVNLVGLAFANNDATRDGGGVWLDDGFIDFVDCKIENNNARGSGGGVWAAKVSAGVGDGSSRPPLWCGSGHISRCRIVGNTAEQGSGGGLCVEGQKGGLGGRNGVICNHTFIVGNRAKIGGGVYAGKWSVVFLYNVVNNENRAMGVFDGVGGGVCVIDAFVEVWFCTVYGNAAELAGGGVYYQHSGIGRNLRIKDSIVYGNMAKRDPGGGSVRRQSGSISIVASDIQALTALKLGGAEGSIRNIDKDPMLSPKDGILYVLEYSPNGGSLGSRVSPCIDAAGEYGDYEVGRLKSGEPMECACSGRASKPFLPWPVDIDGGCRKVRVLAADVSSMMGADMGAYEVQKEGGGASCPE